MDHLSAESLQEGVTIIIDKPLDWTSFQVVNKLKYFLRNSFNLHKLKIGHAGTLDPQATGVLLVCTGKKTKSISQLQDLPKEYIAVIKLGATTACYDSEMPEENKLPVPEYSINDLNTALDSFRGEISQFPPLFSAIKIGGKPAYKIARGKSKDNQELSEDIANGIKEAWDEKQIQEILDPRKVTIYQLEILDWTNPFLKIKVNCSKGTYIRSLAHDIGKYLGCGGYLYSLRRSKIGDFSTEMADQDFQKIVFTNF